ncbi:hypothetical protein STEG23_003179, partial [Scotinomys teguina]
STFCPCNLDPQKMKQNLEENPKSKPTNQPNKQTNKKKTLIVEAVVWPWEREHGKKIMDQSKTENQLAYSKLCISMSDVKAVFRPPIPFNF